MERFRTREEMDAYLLGSKTRPSVVYQCVYLNAAYMFPWGYPPRWEGKAYKRLVI